MIGIDTDFLIAFIDEVHPRNGDARAFVQQTREAGGRFALAPQVASEFIHVVTDAKRFQQPTTVAAAVAVVEAWRASEDVVWTMPTETAVDLFLNWMSQYQLGRKRVLDTLLAATYAVADVHALATLNPTDFVVFGTFEFPLSKL